MDGMNWLVIVLVILAAACPIGLVIFLAWIISRQSRDVRYITAEQIDRYSNDFADKVEAWKKLDETERQQFRALVQRYFQ